jgi:sulfopyruvate decarboxylase alpha subunit
MNELLTSEEFLDELERHNIDFFAGVPDSLFRGLLRLIQERDLQYVPATCEDVAVGMGVGAYLAGRRPCMLIQNSGLGNATDTYMTLNHLYNIPFLFVITWRGFDGNDEVQHLDWGNITFPFLDTIGMPHFLVDKEQYKEQIAKAMRMIEEKKKSAAIIIRRGYFNETG